MDDKDNNHNQMIDYWSASGRLFYTARILLNLIGNTVKEQDLHGFKALVASTASLGLRVRSMG